MKNKRFTILSSLILLSLCSCNIRGAEKSPNDSTSDKTTTNNTDNVTTDNITTDKVSTDNKVTTDKITDKTTTTDSSSSATYKKLTSDFTQQDYSALTYYPYMPSTGEINVLVIPVDVSDYKSNATEKVRTDLQKAMFGKSEDTGWESLTSYYEKSSHGALKINGKVTDWYNPNLSSKQMANKNTNDDYTDKLLSDAVSWYKSKYNDDCTQYDNNKDGYIDGVFLIYSAYDAVTGEELGETLDENLFWAYTTMDYNAEPNLKSPNGGYYFWASYDFLYEGYGTSKVDSHTFVHETGHMLSLTDYYSYTTKDKNGYNTYSPMGGVDMMDYNICEQDCYSKFVLGWNEPYYVDKEGEITINSAATSLDSILIPTKKADVTNSYDEYVMLELFSPSLGLNEKDLREGYGNYTPEGKLNKEGVRAYHVDNRVCTFKDVDSNENPINPKYADLKNIDENNYYVVAHENSVTGYNNGDSGFTLNYMNENYRNVTQLSKSNRVFAKNGYTFENQDMFYKGESFNATKFANQFPNKTKMNNGSELAYNFTVVDIKDHQATIRFTKN